VTHRDQIKMIESQKNSFLTVKTQNKIKIKLIKSQTKIKNQITSFETKKKIKNRYKIKIADTLVCDKKKHFCNIKLSFLICN